MIRGYLACGHKDAYCQYSMGAPVHTHYCTQCHSVQECQVWADTQQDQPKEGE